MTLSREATEHDGGESIYTDEYIKNYRMNNWLDPDAFPITDWQNLLMTGSGLTHNHNVTMSASYGKIRTMASFGYLSQEGIIKSSSMTDITSAIISMWISTTSSGCVWTCPPSMATAR